MKRATKRADESGSRILRFYIKNEQPVHVSDLADALAGIRGQYQRFLTLMPDPIEASDVPLVVRQIRSGSIILDLGVMAQIAVPLFLQQGIAALDQANMLLGYGKRVTAVLRYFLKKGDRPAGLNAKDCRDVSQIMQPVAKDGASQFNLIANPGASISFNFIRLHSNDAAAIQLRASEEIESLKQPTQSRYERVLLYWYQASRDAKARGDRAVIDAITDRPLRVVFGDDATKIKMIQGKDNPFLVGFVVDVEVLTIDHRPVAYKVTALHDEITGGEPPTLFSQGAE